MCRFLAFCLIAVAVFTATPSFGQCGLLLGAGSCKTAAAATTTAFDPANRFQQTLTNSNLTVANSVGSGNFGGVRSLVSHSTGKYYLEWHLDGTPGGDPIQIGICNVSQILSGSVFMGGGANNAGTNSSGSIVSNGGTLGSYGGVEVSGDVIGMAIDVGAKLGWWRINGGLWNFSGGADPATGTGGYDISGVTGDLFFFASVFGTNSGTANTGATGYAHTAPSGFVNWHHMTEEDMAAMIGEAANDNFIMQLASGA